jgi:hypothetical protein
VGSQGNLRFCSGRRNISFVGRAKKGQEERRERGKTSSWLLL